MDFSSLKEQIQINNGWWECDEPSLLIALSLRGASVKRVLATTEFLFWLHYVGKNTFIMWLLWLLILQVHIIALTVDRAGYPFSVTNWYENKLFTLHYFTINLSAKSRRQRCHISNNLKMKFWDIFLVYVHATLFSVNLCVFFKMLRRSMWNYYEHFTSCLSIKH